MSSEVGKVLQRAARLYRARVAHAIADLGLFAGQEQALLLLADKTEMTVGELAEALNVRPPTASKMVLRLVGQKMVDRRDSDADARRTTLSLTKEGQRCAKALRLRLDEVETEISEALDGKDIKRLRKLLKRLSQALATMPASGDDDLSEDD
ncbi:MAG: MarR family transcriptional regulator [Proteobacteria bacterium]|nr:MarR family transcriptional regulator [Pseudomonadota bacterium]